MTAAGPNEEIPLINVTSVCTSDHTGFSGDALASCYSGSHRTFIRSDRNLPFPFCEANVYCDCDGSSAICQCLKKEMINMW